MSNFTTYGKSTLTVRFYDKIPNRYYIFDEYGKIYFYRDLTENNKQIKVNIARAGNFTTNANENIIVGKFEKSKVNIVLPPKEKNYFHDKFIYRLNPKLKGTPARNFYKQGIIEISPKFMSLPFPIRVFILCHEIGHSYYHDEEKADIFATKLYLEKGYNSSMALHSLTDVLNFDSGKNKERVKKLFNILNNHNE